MLVYDIPPGEKVAVVTFHSKAIVNLPLTVVPNALENRQKLATIALPRTPSSVIERQKCIDCGLDAAIEVRSLYNDGSLVTT